MLQVSVSGVGILGPGLNDWQTSRPILAGRRPYVEHELPRPHPTILPATERRRASATVRIGVHIAQEALKQSGLTGDNLATVFASSGGDTEIVHQLCSALAQPEKAVSPTRFHNSVHNAPAGYWSIATGSLAPSCSLTCYDATFAGGLLETACQTSLDKRPVLLAAYDVPSPEPLYQARPLSAPFGAALVLDNGAMPGLAVLTLEIVSEDEREETTVADPKLEALRRGNPAARALPLLVAIAGNTSAEIVLEYVGGNRLRVSVKP